MTAFTVWALFVLFIGKHYVADFPLQQNPYMWQHKHIYWHPGGWTHAGVHGLGTLLVTGLMALFGAVPIAACFLLAVLDAVVHHHVDFWKMNKNRDRNWKPDTHPEFWVLLGQDQALHYATYAAFILLLILL